MRPSVESVLKLLDDRSGPLPPESIAIPLAAGRVLAEPVVSPVAVPGFIRSAMDGFAVRAEDTRAASPRQPGALTLIGDSRPAHPFPGALSAGQAVRITTGAPVPAGADAILVTEAAEVTAEGHISFTAPIAPGKHVSPIGEDVGKDQQVLSPPRRLRPQDIGLLVSIGAAIVPVIRRPRIIILATGDELLPPGSLPSGHAIVDSNSPMLSALAIRDGGEVLRARRVPDQRQALKEALLDACSQADVILISGGSWMGPEDYSARVVAELGELSIHGIALKPGGPTGIGFLPIPVFLLPGNPVACLCAYDLFAGRLIRRLGGRGSELPYRSVQRPLKTAVASMVGRTDYVRVKLEGDEVIAISAGGASILSSTVEADGFMLVPHAREGREAGEVVGVWVYDGGG